MITIREATDADCVALAPKLGEIDKLEISCTSPTFSPYQVLEQAMRLSVQPMAIIDEDEGCISMYGVAEDNTGKGIPWMLNAEGFFSKRLTKRFVVDSKAYIDSQPYTYLYNYISCKNTKSIKWLRTIGFTIDETQTPISINNQPFYIFYKGELNV